MDDFDDGRITIDRKQYEALIEDQRILRALYSGGVDNWEWYDDALSSLEGEIANDQA